MKIAIIGAGNIGGVLTRRFTALGHQVSVANKNPEKLAKLVAETGAKAVSVLEAAKAGDVVVVTIPEGSIRDLPKDLFKGVADDVVVVDTGNYYPRQRDGLIEEIEKGVPESRWVAQQLGRTVVKTFNIMVPDHLSKNGRPAGSADRKGMPVAGDEKRAKEIVISLVEELGFDGIDAGTLDESWRQQPGTPIYGTDLQTGAAREALANATQERQPKWRATKNSPGTQDNPK